MTETITETAGKAGPMNVSEAALFTGLSRNYIYLLAHQKKIPFYKPMGGRIFFKQSDLEEFIYRHKTPAD
ncbi:MAG: helix-turn-helix domain-containing protein, partial [Treponema sp.]|nr:helix-turn-helix domain-containing protein [Treponema sp.]